MTISKKQIADPHNASHAKYARELKRSRATGQCIFCDPKVTSDSCFIKRIGGWTVRKQRYTKWDREGKPPKYCLVIYPDRHLTNPFKFTVKDFTEIKKICAWLVKNFKIKGGAICLRFGDSHWSGATIRHSHFQYIVPRQKKNPKTKEVRGVPLDWPIG